jgi:hypothetical protein
LLEELEVAKRDYYKNELDKKIMVSHSLKE